MVLWGLFAPRCSAVEVLPTGAPLLHLRCCSALAHPCPTCGMTRSWESSLQGGEHVGTEAAGGAGCLVLGVLEFGVWVNGQAKMRLLCNSQIWQVKNFPPLFKATRVIWGGFYILKGSSTPVEVGGKQWWHEQHHEDWGEMPRLELWGGHPGHVPLRRSPGASCRQPASFPLKLNQQDWVGDKWFLYHGAMHRVISSPWKPLILIQSSYLWLPWRTGQLVWTETRSILVKFASVVLPLIMLTKPSNSGHRLCW